jgi:hypothetical protein
LDSNRLERRTKLKILLPIGVALVAGTLFMSVLAQAEEPQNVAGPSPAQIGVFPFKGGGPFPGGVFNVNNMGGLLVNDITYVVYAGAFVSDPDHGMLVVIADDPRATKQDRKSYWPTGTVGSLTIKRVAGSVITFMTPTGSEGSFDVVTELFTTK